MCSKTTRFRWSLALSYSPVVNLSVCVHTHTRLKLSCLAFSPCVCVFTTASSVRSVYALIYLTYLQVWFISTVKAENICEGKVGAKHQDVSQPVATLGAM